MVYAVRMLFFGLALLIAARPDLDNPGCYRDGWDYFRAVCEVISLLCFFVMVATEIQEMHKYVAARYGSMYLLLHIAMVYIGASAC